MKYKFSIIMFFSSLFLIFQFLGITKIVKADNSGNTGAGTNIFTVGMRIVNPSTDMDKPMNFIVSNNLNSRPVMTLREYVTNYLIPADKGQHSLTIEQFEKATFMPLLTYNAGNDTPFLSDGTVKDWNYWKEAAETSGLSADKISKLKKLYDGIKKLGNDVVDKDTTYMIDSMLGDTGIGGDPKVPDGFVGCDIGIGPKLIKTHTGEDKDSEITGAYSVYAIVTPVKPKNFSKLSSEQQAEWERTHQIQRTEPVKTAFGEYLDSHRKELAALQGYGKSGGIGADSSYRKAWESFAAGARKAAAEPLPKISIETSASNQEGMNKGGAFTYTEMVKDATVSAPNGPIQHSQDYYDEYGCVNHEFVGTYDVYDKDGNREVKTYTYNRTKYEKINSNKMIDGNYTKTGIVVIEGHDYKPNNSWQFISVRCNQEEFNSLVASTGSTVLQNGKASSSAKSQVTSGSVATFYNHLTIDFYYTGKTCDDIWGCTIEPNNGANNDSANNKAKRGDLLNNSFGAQSDGKTGSKFVMFRDNISRTIRNDVAWPKLTNATPEVTLDTKQPASGTYVILDKNGTPNKDLFNFEDSQKSTLISGSELETKWYKSFKSQENVFNWRASWASDSNKPHRMNIRYAYKPQVSAAIKTAFDRDGGSDGKNTFTLDIICPNKFNTEETYNPTIVNQPKNLDYSQPKTDFDDSENSYLEVNFVKASAEQ